MATMPSFYRVRAVNTAVDSENRIHGDAVAAAYGFRAGLVPGVTVYGYMTLPVLDRFGAEWLERGTMSVRFKEPVYDGEEVAVEGRELDGGRMEVTLERGRADGLASMEQERVAPEVENYPERPMPARENRPAASRETLAKGTALGTLRATLDLAAARMSAPLAAAIGEARLAHPAVLLGVGERSPYRQRRPRTVDPRFERGRQLLGRAGRRGAQGPWAGIGAVRAQGTRVCRALDSNVRGRTRSTACAAYGDMAAAAPC